MEMSTKGNATAARTSFEELLRFGVERNASDLHLIKGAPPTYRIGLELIPTSYGKLTGEDTKRLSYEKLNEEEIKEFESRHELVKAFSGYRGKRFRMNINMQRGHVGSVTRILPTEVKSIEELGLHQIVAEMAIKDRGLILIIGPPATGKTTTMSAIIDWINRKKGGHIIILEDPIEYLHSHRKGIVMQREIGRDTNSFEEGLRSALRQDPDVIALGELRDLETIRIALNAAEIGRLILGTLHTYGTGETIDRIIGIFPPEQQRQVGTQLSMTLEGIISQTLIPRLGGGKVAALQIMTMTDAIRNCIRGGDLKAIDALYARGEGMLTRDTSLQALLTQGKISKETYERYRSTDTEGKR